MARAFLKGNREALQEFQKLPSRVQKDVHGCLYVLHLKMGKKIQGSKYGNHAFNGLAGLSSTNEEKAKSMFIYIAKTFLPDVINLFEKAMAEENTQGVFASAAYARFNGLPSSIKKNVYEALYEIHKHAKKLPAKTPGNYGELAFNNQNDCSASDLERISAIKNALKRF